MHEWGKDTLRLKRDGNLESTEAASKALVISLDLNPLLLLLASFFFFFNFFYSLSASGFPERLLQAQLQSNVAISSRLPLALTFSILPQCFKNQSVFISCVIAYL